MIDLDEINKTILQLESRDTTFAACEKLADLYIVRDHIIGQQQKQPVPLSIFGDSEFLKAVNGKNSVAVWEVMDELMESLKMVSPKVYVSVLRKLNQL